MAFMGISPKETIAAALYSISLTLKEFIIFMKITKMQHQCINLLQHLPILNISCVYKKLKEKSGLLLETILELTL